MGLSKKLEEEESSFTFSTNAPSGDGGWAPAEVLLCKRKTMKVDVFGATRQLELVNSIFDF